MRYYIMDIGKEPYAVNSLEPVDFQEINTPQREPVVWETPAKWAPLSPEAELDLCRRVRNCMPGAEAELCRQYEPGLKSLLKEYCHYTLAWDDKLTAARMGLIKAARTLDQTRGRLMTHARGKIFDEMGRAVDEANNLERLPVVDMPEAHRE